MTGNFLVTVLIPTYNREDLITETVQSVLNQTYQDFEIVIVDNQSTDNTYQVCLDLAKTDPRIRIYQNEENIGPVRNWQRCAELAEGKYGKILFSDDLMYPKFIEKTLAFLEENSDIGFVFTSAKVGTDELNSTEAYLYQKGLVKSSKFLTDILLNRYPLSVSPCLALFRIEDLKKNILDHIPSSKISDFSAHGAGPDLLLMLLTAQNYKFVAHIPEHLSFFRRLDDNLTSSLQSKSDLYLYECYDQAKIWFCKKNHKYLLYNWLIIKSWLKEYLNRLQALGIDPR